MKRLLLSFTALLMLTGSTLVAVPTPALAASASTNSACKALTELNPDQDCGSNPKGSVNSLVSNVVNLLSLFVGIVAVVMIIVGGIKYVTSGGDSAKVTSAKNTLVYAVIGLVVAALAQFIVHYVLWQLNK